MSAPSIGKNNYFGFPFDSKFKDDYRDVYQNRVLENLTLLLNSHLRLVIEDYGKLIDISDQVIIFVNEEIKNDSI